MTLDEQIAHFEGEVRASQDALVKLYEQKVAETRLMSEDDRGAILENLADRVDNFSTSETVEHYMQTQYFDRGWADLSDPELLEFWFACIGPEPSEITKHKLWADSLSSNLGVVGEFGKWLNKKKEEKN